MTRSLFTAAIIVVSCCLALSAGTAQAAGDDAPAATAAQTTTTKTPAVKTVHADKTHKAQAATAKTATGTPAAAQPAASTETGASGAALKVPRFVTLGADEVNVRTGPALKYPIKFVIRKDGLPVEILREFDVWRDIRDMDGDGGWVLKSMLSGKRAVVVTKQVQSLLKKPDPAARPVVKLEPGVIAGLSTCKGQWCHLKVQTYSGWIKRDGIWGIYPDERFQE